MKILTLRQPWAFLIAAGFKDIENRSWQTPYRGPLLIHAGKSPCPDELRNHVLERHGIVIPDVLEYGGVVAVAELTDCVRAHPSPWFHGPIGWVLADRRPLPFTPCRGFQHLFDPPAELGGRFRQLLRKS